MATLKEIRAKAREIGCVIEVDGDCQCYRATAPSGKRWEPELHELVSVFGGGIIGNDATRAEAREDMLDRLKDYDALEDCDEPDCDWCDHNPHAQIMAAELGEG